MQHFGKMFGFGACDPLTQKVSGPGQTASAGLMRQLAAKNVVRNVPFIVVEDRGKGVSFFIYFSIIRKTNRATLAPVQSEFW
jgi:hypothetical protein